MPTAKAWVNVRGQDSCREKHVATQGQETCPGSSPREEIGQHALTEPESGKEEG